MSASVGYVHFSWDGEKAKRAAKDGAARGLRLAALHLLERSRAIVPWDEGTLSASGGTDFDEGIPAATVFYNTVYARRQHEELDWVHKPGRSAKYLERPLHEEAETMQQIIGEQIQRSNK